MRNHKISTGKKIFVALVATIGFLTFSSLSLADPLNVTINEKKTATQPWEIDASNTNAVTFQDGEAEAKGSIAVTATATAGSGNAANVTFAEGVEDKATSLLTVNFNNDASVETDIDKPASEGEGKVKAHIYAKSEQNGVPAVGINLAEGVNLAINSGTEKIPVLAAYANVYSDTAGANANSAAVTISAANTNRIELNDNSSLFSSSNSTSTGTIFALSASSVIGSAVGYSTAAVTANGLTATFGSSNTITSTSTTSTNGTLAYSASSVIGAAVGNASDTVTASGLTATLGSSNILNASSSSGGASHSASSVIGSAVGLSSYTVTASGLTATLGSSNILNASSSSGDASHSASSVMGSAVGYSTAAVTVSNLTATLGSGNTLTSTSTSTSSSAGGIFRSASSVIGSAVGISSTASVTATVNNLTATLKNDNILSASSSSAGGIFRSASSVIGSAVGDVDEASATATVNGLTATLGNNNILSASSSSSYSASSVIGAAMVYGTGTANAVTVNMNGNQTLSAVAYASTPANIRVNTFGADKTDKGNGDSAFGWRVGIFAAGTDITEGENTIANAVTGDSTVNILGAKLSSAWVIEGDKAKATLGGDQGANSSNYARAFALGNDFKIYIGGRAKTDDHSFETVVSNGKTNVVNIIGAISQGRNSTNTEGSSLTVDSGWTVNAFGPVEGLAEISVKGGSHLNIYGATTSIGKIELWEGNLRLSNSGADATEFNNAIQQIAGKMTYKDPQTGTLYKGSEGKITIDTTSYPWNGSSGGKLTLNEGNVLIFHVDSTKKDKGTNTATNGDDFELVKGYVTIDAGMKNAITFSGGKIAIIGDAASDANRELPANVDFWLIRSTENEAVQAAADMLGFDLSTANNFERVNPNLYKLTSDYENQIFSKGINPYANWNESLGVYIFNDPAHNSSGLFLGTGETPRHVVPSEYAASHANVELASLVMNANTLVINALAERMTSVKGCLADPFIHALYGHAHQNEIEGIGYNNNMGGFIIGIDDVWTFSNERYLRLGAAFGYVQGKTNFFGSATGLEKSAKHNACSLTLFGVYESFNDKNLKTNIGVTLGYCHGKDILRRTDPDDNNFDGQIQSDSTFLGLEFVKNLYAHKGYNFGLWCRANYSRIAQKGYDESSSATTGAQHVSAINHNFLTTVVGINIEKEIFNQEYADKKLTLSLKAGWESQIMRKHSDATASFDNNLGIGEFSPTLGSPSRNAAIVSIGASQKLNVNWSITGSYVARFNKDISTHNLSCGAEYSF